MRSPSWYTTRWMLPTFPARVQGLTLGFGVWGLRVNLRHVGRISGRTTPSSVNFCQRTPTSTKSLLQWSPHALICPVRLVINRVGNQPGGLLLHAPLFSKPKALAETLVGTNEEETEWPPRKLGFNRDAEIGRARSVPFSAIAALQPTRACAGHRASEGRTRCCRGGSGRGGTVGIDAV